MNTVIFSNLKTYFNNNPLHILIIWFLCITIIKSVVSLFIDAPQSLGDEMYYDLIARMIAHGEILLGTAQYPSGYPPGYPALLSIAHVIFSDRIAVYHGELIINAILSSLMIFPAFFILKRFSSVQTAVMGALTISVISVILAPSFLLMSENLFTILFLLASCGLIHSFSEARSGPVDIITGLLIIGSVTVRPVGIALVFALIISLIYYAVHRPGSIKSLVNKSLLLTSPIIVISVCWGLDQLFLHKLPGVHAAVFLSPGVFPLIGEHLMVLIHTTVLGGLYLAYTPFLFLFAVASWYIYQVFRSTDENDVSVDQIPKTDRIVKKTTLVFILISSLLLFAIAIFFIFGFIHSDIPHIYGRYVDPVIPFIILFGFAGTEHLTRISKEDRDHFFRLFFVYLILVTGIGAYTFLPSLTDQNNNAGVFYLYSLSGTFNGIVLILPLLLSVGYYYIISRQVPVCRIYLIILLICLLTTLPVISWQVHMGQNYGEIHRAFNTIQERLGADDVYIWDQTGNNGRYDLVYHDSLKFWIGTRLVEKNTDKTVTPAGDTDLKILNKTTGDYLISRQDYSRKKVAKMEDFWFYPISSGT